ncbi:hypothetical protein F4604DRAFT_1914549 [Suillus subluteus]|nr:hypothetical protein F4604DRAFT_1914549 [Suillus subluteus]
MDGLGHQNNKRKHAQYDLFPGDHDHELDAQGVPSSPTNKRKVFKTSLNCTRSSEVSNYLTERKLELSRVTRRVIAAKARLQRLRSLELELIKSINDDELEITKQELTATDLQIGYLRNELDDAGVVIGDRGNGCTQSNLLFLGGGSTEAPGTDSGDSWTPQESSARPNPKVIPGGSTYRTTAVYGRPCDLCPRDPTNPEVMQFYTNQTIIDNFKNYIKVVLTRINQFTGLTHAEDPTIFAYETGDELGGPIFGDMWVPTEWTEQIASRSLPPPNLSSMVPMALMQHTSGSIPTVDILSDHLHSPDIAKLQSDISLVQSVNKAYIAE